MGELIKTEVSSTRYEEFIIGKTISNADYDTLYFTDGTKAEKDTLIMDGGYSNYYIYDFEK